jgi:hypothetical protein
MQRRYRHGAAGCHGNWQHLDVQVQQLFLILHKQCRRARSVQPASSLQLHTHQLFCISLVQQAVHGCFTTAAASHARTWM